MATERWRAIRKWAARIASVLVALPLLYVLSFGPANRWATIRIASDEETDIEAMQTFYGPLVTLSDQCPPFETALMWYIELWMF